jgi:adenylate cyclase
VWSERYDRTLEDVFAVQSEISEEILVAVGIKINEAERARLQRKPTRDFTAYEAVSKGYAHFYRFTRKDNEEARRLAQRALELDPEYANAVALLAGTYSVEYGTAWNLDRGLLDRAREMAQRAIELDPGTPSPYIVLASFHLQQGAPELAADYARQAIETAPNRADGHIFLGFAMIQQGRPLEGLPSLRRSLRLDPRISPLRAVIHHLTGRSEEAVKLWERAREANPDSVPPRISLIRHYVSAGRLAEAHPIVSEILAINPGLTAEVLARHGIGRPPEDEVPALVASLRRAGLP